MKNESYVVVRGRMSIPGSIDCRYVFFDLIDIDTSKDLEDQLRKYSFETFSGENCSIKEDDLTCRRKHIILHNGIVLSERIKIFDSPKDDFLGFIPVNDFLKDTFVTYGDSHA